MRSADVAKGALAGAIGGAAGAWLLGVVMRRVQGEPPATRDPKLKVGSEVSERLTGEPLAERAQPLAARAVHDSTGIASGALYGAVVEVAPWVRALWGALFGAAVWAALPEATLPALGLAPPPWKRPVKDQAMSLGMHLAYGVATESVRRPVRAALG